MIILICTDVQIINELFFVLFFLLSRQSQYAFIPTTHLISH